MKHFAVVLSASALVTAGVVRRDYGYQFSSALAIGPVADNNFIREAVTTLELPELNSPQTGNLALWPGMGTSGGHLVQGLAISVLDGSAGCPKVKGKWCIVGT